MLSRLTSLLSPLLRRPLCCLVLLWAGGIPLAGHLAMPVGAWCIATGILLLGWWCAAAMSSRQLPQLALACAVVCCSAGVAAWRLAPLQPGDPAYLAPGGVVVVGYPLAAVSETDYGWHTTFRLTARRTGARWQTARGTLYLTGSGSAPRPGRYYTVVGRVLPADDAGNPFGFSWQTYLAERGLSYRLRALALHALPRTAPTASLSALRAQCSARLAASMPSTYSQLHAQLLESLILGVYGSPLPDAVVEQFRRAGTIHLMVVSGSQVALLGGLFLLPLTVLPFGHARTSYPRLRRVLLVCSLLALGLYVMLADHGPSVNRALFMVLLTALSLLLALSPLGRQRSFRPDGLTLLAVAGLLILLCQPTQLYSPGFQLSFAAVFGLCTITPVLMRCWPRWPRFLALPLAATLGAQCMTYPILAWHFGAIPLLAPLTNLIAVPLVGLLLPLGVLTLGLAFVSPTLACGLNYLNLILLKGLLLTNALASRCPFAEVHWYTRSPWAVLLYLALLAIVIMHLSSWIHRKQHGWNVSAGRAPRMW